MPVKTEPNDLGDLLKYETDALYCREQVTILAGAGADRALTQAMVLGKITASGKYVQLNPAGADGSEKGAGVLLFDCTAADGADNPDAVALVRGPAIVSDGALVWPGGILAAAKTAALADLKAAGILARAGA